MIQPKVTVDTRNFDRAFARYLEVSKRSLSEICNKKLAMVVAGATRQTRRASRAAIQAELGKYVTVQETNKRGKLVNRRKLQLNTRKGHAAPLAELIINSRLAREGKKGIGGTELALAVRKMIAARLRSVAFLASSWLPALKTLLAALQERSTLKYDRSVKWYGKPKGDATPAKPGWNPSATMTSDVSKGGDKVSAIISDGVQKALDEEAASMDRYVEEKLGKDTEHFNHS